MRFVISDPGFTLCTFPPRGISIHQLTALQMPMGWLGAELLKVGLEAECWHGWYSLSRLSCFWHAPSFHLAVEL